MRSHHPVPGEVGSTSRRAPLASPRSGRVVGDSVLFRQDHTELSEGAVNSVAVPGHPELEAIALPPVRVGLFAGLVLILWRSPHQPNLRRSVGCQPTASLQVSCLSLATSSVRACSPLKPCSCPRGPLPPANPPMPRGSNSRGRRYSVSGMPALRWMTLASANVQGWL